MREGKHPIMTASVFNPFDKEPHPEDPVLDARTVLGLARQHVPSATSVTRIAESGGEARTYFIDDGYLVKTQRPQKLRASTSLAKETFHLQRIAKDAPDVSVPRALGYGQSGNVEYILMTRMPGQATRYLAFEGPARRATLVEVGRALRRIHSVDLDAVRASELFPGDVTENDVRQRIESGLLQATETVVAQEGIDLGLPPEALVARIMQLVQPGELAPLHTILALGPATGRPRGPAMAETVARILGQERVQHLDQRSFFGGLEARRMADVVQVAVLVE